MAAALGVTGCGGDDGGTGGDTGTTGTTQSPGTTTGEPGTTTGEPGTTSEATTSAGTTTGVEPTTGEPDTTTGGPGAVCGDGVLDAGEDCDVGADNSDVGACTSKCKDAVCGDGLVKEGAEACDDGNQVEDDECTNYSSFPATAPTRQLTSKLHGRNRWVFPRPATGPPTASPRPCPPGLEKSWRREMVTPDRRGGAR
jgi:cysteine-rich repeat protein